MSEESGQVSRFSTTKCNLSDSGDKIHITESTLTSTIVSLAVRRPDTLALAPIDTTVQLKKQNQRDTPVSVDSGVDVNDGPTKTPRRTLKSIDIGFTDLSYTVKVWRYDKLRRGESELIFFYGNYLILDSL